MNSTLYHGVSGIKTHQFGIDSVSNNIANVNTDGYRGNIATFKSLFARQMDYLNAGRPVNSDFELGATVQSNAIDTREGVYKISDESPFNMAIAGKGWLIVGTNKEGSYDIAAKSAPTTQQNYFTRAGAFRRNSEGYVVNDEGYYLYGIDLGKIKGTEFNSAFADKTKTPQEIREAETEALKGTKLKPFVIPEGLVFKPTLTTNVTQNVNLNKTERLTAPNNFLTDSAGTFDMERFLGYDMNILNVSGDSGAQAGDASSLKSISSLYTGDINLEVATDRELTINKYDLTQIKNNYEGGELLINGNAIEGAKIIPRGNYAEVVSAAKEGKKIKILGSTQGAENQNGIATITINGTQYSGVLKDGSFSIEVPATEIVKPSTQKIKYGDDFKTVKEFLDKIKEVSGLDAEFTENCNIKLSNGTENDVLVDFSSKGGFAKSLGLASEPVMLTKKIPDATVQLATNSTESRQLKSAYYVTNTDIYDEDGDKFILQSKYMLKNYGSKSATPPVNEEWEVETQILDKSGLTKVSQKVYRGVLSFDANGKPTYTSSTGANSESIDFKDGKITYNPAGKEGLDEAGLSTNRVHDYSQVTKVVQDGNARGLLTDIAIDRNGLIQLQFSNNKFETMGRVGITKFVNDQGLTKTGSNLFSINYQRINGNTKAISGFPVNMWDNETGELDGSYIMQGKIEGSNVDMSTALTELIVFQRGYSASAKSFTTGDELLKEAIQLKR